jgi:hypothetical protein
MRKFISVVLSVLLMLACINIASAAPEFMNDELKEKLMRGVTAARSSAVSYEAMGVSQWAVRAFDIAYSNGIINKPLSIPENYSDTHRSFTGELISYMREANSVSSVGDKITKYQYSVLAMEIHKMLIGQPRADYDFRNLLSPDVKIYTDALLNISSDGHLWGNIKTYAPYYAVHNDIRGIFKDIFEGSERFPIKDIGGYSWRGGSSMHSYGLAVDINSNENFYIRGGTQIGSHWKPYADIYSITPYGDVVRAFEKRGWVWLQGDYMHFSYSGY